jgi:hypothetical protein
VACGGARYGLGPDPSGDSGGDSGNGGSVDEASLSDDAGDDGWGDDVTAITTETEGGIVKLYFDSGDRNESGEDTAVDIVAPGDGAVFDSNLDSNPVCTPIPSSSYTCSIQGRQSITVITPSQYCAQHISIKGFAVPMPAACQCAETWGCACLLMYGDPCRGFGSYDGSFSGCNDSQGFLAVACP